MCPSVDLQNVHFFILAIITYHKKHNLQEINIQVLIPCLHFKLVIKYFLAQEQFLSKVKKKFF